MINTIPLAALGAVLVHIGYKLAGPHKWRHIAELGNEQLFVFTATVITTVCTDLLMGIGVGMLLKALIVVYYIFRAQPPLTNPISRLINSVRLFFCSPLMNVNVDGDTVQVYFTGAVTCFNCLKVRSSLDGLGPNVRKLVLHFTPTVLVVDHSTSMYINGLKEDWRRAGKDVEIHGLADLRLSAKDRSSFKHRLPVAAPVDVSSK